MVVARSTRMPNKTLLGELEQVVLLAVIRLGSAAYAVTIRDEIRDRTGIDLSRGTVYVTLERLARKGLLESWFADPTPERGGKAKRYFKATPAARRALADCRDVMARMWDGVEAPAGRR